MENERFGVASQLISSPLTNVSDLHASFLAPAPVGVRFIFDQKRLAVRLWLCCYGLLATRLWDTSPRRVLCVKTEPSRIDVIRCFGPVPQCNVLYRSRLIFIFVSTAKCGYWLLDALNCRAAVWKKITPFVFRLTVCLGGEALSVSFAIKTLSASFTISYIKGSSLPHQCLILWDC